MYPVETQAMPKALIVPLNLTVEGATERDPEVVDCATADEVEMIWVKKLQPIIRRKRRRQENENGKSIFRNELNGAIYLPSGFFLLAALTATPFFEMLPNLSAFACSGFSFGMVAAREGSYERTYLCTPFDALGNEGSSGTAGIVFLRNKASARF